LTRYRIYSNIPFFWQIRKLKVSVSGVHSSQKQQKG